MDPTKPIVLRYPGWEVDCHCYTYTREGMTVMLLNGLEINLRNADLPTRRFSAAPALLQGAPHPWLPSRRYHCHLLPDVRVGDVVTLYLDGPLGKEEGVGVTIRRRPGGRVPHSLLNTEFFRDMIDRCNAYQDHEERGAPIPDRFRRDLELMRFEGKLRGEAPADPPPPPKRP